MRMGRKFVGASVGALLFAGSLWVAIPATQAGQRSCDGCSFVAAALRARQAIHVGDTRAKLEKTFEMGGGMSMADQSRYVYRDCRELYVDVTFHLAGGQSSNPTDTITSISTLSVDDPVVN